MMPKGLYNHRKFYKQKRKNKMTKLSTFDLNYKDKDVQKPDSFHSEIVLPVILIPKEYKPNSK